MMYIIINLFINIFISLITFLFSLLVKYDLIESNNYNLH